MTPVSRLPHLFEAVGPLPVLFVPVSGFEVPLSLPALGVSLAVLDHVGLGRNVRSERPGERQKACRLVGSFDWVGAQIPRACTRTLHGEGDLIGYKIQGET